MRTFTNLRKFLASEGSLHNKVDKLEKNTDRLFKIVFERLDYIDSEAKKEVATKRNKVGF